MVVIIDDREDVWNFAPNLIHVRPYHFFQHTGDINAPPGLSKQEKDDKEGFDFKSLNKAENSSEGSSSEVLNGSTSKSEEKDKESPEKVLSDEDVGAGTQVGGEVTETPCEYVEAKQDDGAMGTADDMKETKDITTENNLEKTKENSKESEEPPLEKTVEENVPKQTELSSESEKSSAEKENGQIHIRDTDDYLLHLQDILRNIHGAYYELYDGNQENGDETKAVPDMKIVLPYVRRKTLKEVHVVFSGVVPTNTPLERSKPYLVAKSLGANIMTRVSEETTHIIAARLGTAKVNNKKQIIIVT
jgi:RNA polymerase II subunit A-like phosphatase